MQKKIFDIENYTERYTYAMHCKTYEEAVEFTQYLDSVGKKWCDGNRYTPENTNFGRYGEDTCYEFVSGSYCGINYFRDNRYKILEFENFEIKDIYVISEEERALFDEFIGGFQKTS